jgi:inner membrane transporter RhtA
VRSAPPEGGAFALRQMGRAPAAVLVLLGMCLFQCGAVLATRLFATVGPAGATFLRLAFAALIMSALWHPLPWPLSRAQLRAVLSFGLLLGTMNLSFYEAIDRIPLGTTITIQFAGPLTVAVFGRRRPLDLVWVALAAAGILALMAPGGAGVDGVGVAFAALAGAGWAGYIVFGRRLGALFPDSRGLALGLIVACSVPLVPGVVDTAHADLGLVLIPLGLAVALLSSVLPHTLDTEALRRMSPGVFGVFMSLEPMLGSFAGAIFLGQRLSGREWLGVALVVIAAVGIMRRRAEVPERV